MNFDEIEKLVGWDVPEVTDRCLRGYQIREQEIHDQRERKIECQVIFEALTPADFVPLLALIRAAKMRECPGYLEGMTARLNKIAVYQTPDQPSLVTIQLGIQAKRSTLARSFPNALGSSPTMAPKRESKIDKRFAKIEIDPEAPKSNAERIAEAVNAGLNVGVYEFDPGTGEDRIVSIKRDGDDSAPKKLDLVIPIHVGKPVAVYQRPECPFNYCDDVETCKRLDRCRHS